MPTPTVYSSTGTQWPILQSKTEQKFKSGLFNVRAEFIRPVGNTDLPTEIETSIGPVDVWPEPTVSIGTDGFERINATGYGVWQYGIQEVIYSYNVQTISGEATTFTRCKTDDFYELETFGEGEQAYQAWVLKPGCGDKGACGTIQSNSATQIKGPPVTVILESVYIKSIGGQIPLNPGISLYNGSGQKITGGIVASTAPEPPPSTDPNGPPEFSYLSMLMNSFYQLNEYAGSFGPLNLFFPVISSLKKNKYGEIIETEVVYSLRGPSSINFGDWIEGHFECVPPVEPPPPDPL